MIQFGFILAVSLTSINSVSGIIYHWIIPDENSFDVAGLVIKIVKGIPTVASRHKPFGNTGVMISMYVCIIPRFDVRLACGIIGDKIFLLIKY